MPENIKETSIETAGNARPPVKPTKKHDGKVDRIVGETKQLTDDLTEWVNLRIRLIQLDIQERIDQELDFVFSGMIVIGMIMIALFMASFGIAYVLGDVLGERWHGFAIVAVVYLVVALFISRVRPRLAGDFRASWFKDRLERGAKSTEKEQ